MDCKLKLLNTKKPVPIYRNGFFTELKKSIMLQLRMEV